MFPQTYGGKMDTESFCVIAGDPVSGFIVYGPFAHSDDATEWGIDNVAHDLSFWVTELKSGV